MNIILLSGGSGKRLWPLSNDIRSKQFVFRMIDSQKYVRFTIDYKSVVTSVILLSLECWLAINLHDNFSYITSMIILLMIIIIYSKTLLVCAKTFLNKVKR